MSLFNQLGEFELNQLIARRLTTPGPAPSPTVEPAIFPSLVLESDRPEWGYISGERLCAFGGGVVAVAGQNSAFALTNPVGSNTIITVRRVNVNVGASTVNVLLTTQGVTVAPTTPGVLDSRWSSAPPAVARGVGTCVAGAAALGAFAEPVLFRLPASLSSEINEPIIVSPGWVFAVLCNTVNVGINAFSVSWRERTAQPGEL